MVRFIINNFKMYEMYDKNLHSNMVRFIMQKKATNDAWSNGFTFQYG